MALISIVVRTKGRSFFLGRALASIVAQSDPVVEVVVVNDGGPVEDVEDVVAAACSSGLNAKIVHNPISLGRAAAWNAGWHGARGDWLAALDDDDTWAPDFLRSVRGEIAANAGRSGFGVVTQTMEVREEASGDSWTEVRRVPFNPRFTEVRLRDLVLQNRFTNNAFVFPRATLATVGEIREDLDVLEDWDFNVRFAARLPIRVIPQPLAHYRRRPGGRGEAWANSDLARHQVVRSEIREGWLRADLESGRWGLGALGLLAEVEANRGLRLSNRIASWFGR